jgi:hypothetical protein
LRLDFHSGVALPLLPTILHRRVSADGLLSLLSLLMRDMRLLRIAIVIRIVGAGTSEAATITAASCASAAVQTAINAAAAATRSSFPTALHVTSGVSITGKGVILLGQSAARVVITNNVSGNAITVKENTLFIRRSAA